MSQRIPQILTGVLLGLLTVTGYAVIQFRSGAHVVPAEVVSPGLEAYPASDFTLTDQHGEEVSLRDFRGRTVVLFFGFTHCPDVCPATLLNLSRALDGLPPEDRERVQGVLVTVDPERDTPERLSQYLEPFHPSLVGLTGSPEEILEVTEAYGIFAQQVEGAPPAGEHHHRAPEDVDGPGDPEGSDHELELPSVVPSAEDRGYMVEHTARTFVIDGAGQVVHSFAPFTPAEEMEEELARLLSGA